ncbi:MAG TPA: GTP 3',8-cyclase MoaA [Fibrobacteria bacterium]|nr:GTP 3',8-cyclase MoaA [Fibrobacteria bacterium]
MIARDMISPVSLVDPVGRVMRKLRVSLTDACQYRCFYCMPEHATFTPSALLLRPAEYGSLCRDLLAQGIEEVRVTGGEPTVRAEFREVMTVLAGLGARRLSLTSNGQLLARHLEFLHDLGCRHLNISLDSLDAGRFERITRGGDFRTVMACIERAAALGFTLKVNAVVFRGINDDEIPDFAHWSESSGIEVRFLEFMKIGPGHATTFDRFVSADEMIARLRPHVHLQPVEVPHDSTSFVFETAGGGRLGFIASESKPFCGTCSRLRLSATGVLRSCLMSERGVSLRGLKEREGEAAYAEAIRRVLAMKPTGRLDHVDQAMHEIGG